MVAVKLLHKDAKAPTRANRHAAGFDLYAITGAELPPWSRLLVPTGIAVSLPRGTYGRIAPRSGLASKQGVAIMAGVVDNDYRGEIHVLLLNASYHFCQLEAGDRIAQLILERYDDDPDVMVVDTLPGTERGSGGFGSTGR